VEQTVCITDAGRKKLSNLKDSDDAKAPTRALRLLADEGEIELKAFCLRMGVARAPKWFRALEQEGLIERSYRTSSTPTRAKRRKAVRLAKSPADFSGKSEDSKPRETRAQQRVIETLRTNQGE